MSEYVSVADAASLAPGRGRTVHVQGREFALFNLGGRFHAIDNECPHVGGPLGAGTIEDGCVYCPLHGWAFDVRTGACRNVPSRPVHHYPARVEGGQVQIKI